MVRSRILIAGPNWIGDLVIADTLFKLLKQAEPDTPIDLLAPAWALPLAARMAEIERVIETPGGHGQLALAARYRLARQLRKNGYSRAYVLPRSAKAALLPWLARVPRRTGYRGEVRHGLINDMRRVNLAQRSVAERYAALAFAPGAELPADLPRPELTSTEAQRAVALERLGVNGPRLKMRASTDRLKPAINSGTPSPLKGEGWGEGDRLTAPLRGATPHPNLFPQGEKEQETAFGPLKPSPKGEGFSSSPSEIIIGADGAVALAPGAEYGSAKRWPIEKFALLAEWLAAAGRTIWVLGSVNERALGEAIRARVPTARNLAGETTLPEAVDLLAAAAAVVTNDSGLMHVAAAVGTPLVAIYGSSSPRYTPPASSRARMIYHSLPCSPCFERVCPLNHTNCLRGIGVDEVLAAITALEKESRA